MKCRRCGNDRIKCNRCKTCCGCVCQICPMCKVVYTRSRLCGHNNCKCPCNCKRTGGANRYASSLQLKTLNNYKTIIGPPTYVGVEMEFSRIVSSDQLRRYGTWTRDGSVRTDDGDAGYEFVSTPLYGDELAKGLSSVVNTIQSPNYRINDACGLHVHVDLRGFTPQEVLRIYVMYTRLESDFYALCQPHRLESEYARPLTIGPNPSIKPMQLEPWMPKNEALGHLLKLSYNIEIDTWPKNTRSIAALGLRQLQNYKSNRRNGGDGGAIEENSRYAGLNIHSYFYRGSVEFRMKEMTKDVDDVFGWVLMCAWFCCKVANLPYAKLSKVSRLYELFDCFKTRPIREYVESRISML